MIKINSLIILCVSLLSGYSHAFPGRAGVCSATNVKEIESGMGGTNQDLGFVITADKDKVLPGEAIKVTINGKRPFKGLLFYVIDEKKTRYAGWSALPGGYQFLDTQCSTSPASSTISHSNPNEKTQFTLQWTAPSQAVGEWTFAGVIASASNQWQVLPQLKVKGAATTNASAATRNATIPASQASPSASQKENVPVTGGAPSGIISNAAVMKSVSFAVSLVIPGFLFAILSS
jgi:hypothetical protein